MKALFFVLIALFLSLSQVQGQGRKLSFSVPDTLITPSMACTDDGLHCYNGNDLMVEYTISEIHQCGTAWCHDWDHGVLVTDFVMPANYHLKVGDIVLIDMGSGKMLKVKVPVTWKGFYFHNSSNKNRAIWLTLRYPGEK